MIKINDNCITQKGKLLHLYIAIPIFESTDISASKTTLLFYGKSSVIVLLQDMNCSFVICIKMVVLLQDGR